MRTFNLLVLPLLAIVSASALWGGWGFVLAFSAIGYINTLTTKP